MARSEAARELAAKQKAAKKAEKERRRNSEDPRDWGMIRQLRFAYKETASRDSKLRPLMLVGFLIPVIFSVVMAAVLGDGWVMWIVFGVLLGLIVAMWILMRRLRRATLEQARGQVGSAAAALGMLPERQWSHDLGIAVTKSQDLVHRAIGPAGVVLIGEGEPGRLKRVITSEETKHANLVTDLPVYVVQMGDKTDQVPLEKLARHIQKFPKALDKYQVSEVRSRVRALDAVRPRVPMPHGPMPTSARQVRGTKRALRG